MMKSPNFIYLSRLDHLRLYAALLVFFHHFRGTKYAFAVQEIKNIGDMMRLWLENGSSGVSLFLVLSAFLFTLITHAGDKQIIYKNFIYNRILRIFPLVTVLIFIVITCNRGHSSPMDIFRLLTLQLNTGNNITGWGHDYFPSGPIWTVAVEFQFYLLFPFLMVFTKKIGISYLWSAVVFFILLRIIITLLNSTDMYYAFYHTIIGRLDQFLIGIILGIAYIRRLLILNNILYLIGIILALLLLSILFLAAPSPNLFKCTFYFPVEACLWGVVIWCYLSLQNFVFCYRWINTAIQRLGRLLAYLGGLSFSLYLLHLPVGIAVSHILHLQEPQTLSQSIGDNLLRLPFILLFSLLSYHVVEKPFMALRTKYIRTDISKKYP